MAAAEPSAHECPVCHDDYTQPKLLRCTHIVCRKCLISWLSKEGNQGGCPLCRTPILPDSSKGQGDLGSMVDTLPTDLITASLVESQHIFNSPNTCACRECFEAKFFCLQCHMKLCNFCAKMHQKIPAIQHHIVEDLSNITAEKLAKFQQSSCSSHENETAKLYCRSHQELICVLCATSSHRQCLDVGGIGEEAKVQREELKKQVERFIEKEKAVEEKIKELDRQLADGKTKFQMMRNEIKSTFYDLKQALEAQYQKLNTDLDKKEEAYNAENKAPRAELDILRAGLAAHTNIMRQVASASDDFLLGMLSKLKSHLDDLESQEFRDKTSKGAIELKNMSLQAELVTDLKKLICKLGEDGSQNTVCSLCGNEKSGMGGPEYAAIMKVGDRVRRGRDWDWGNQDGNPPGIGTIVCIDTGQVFAVQVKWDCGNEKLYRMGHNSYDLQLA